MRKFLSEFLLLVVTIIWGFAFVWQNQASKVLGSFSVVGFRALIASVFLLLVIVFVPSLYRMQAPKIKLKKIPYQHILLPLACGLALFFGMYIQQLGIAQTTASKAGFISVMYICIVPIIGLFFGSRINKFFSIGLIFAVVGLYLMSIKGDFTLEYGDFLVFISAFLFAVHILVIDFSAIRLNSMYLSAGQLVVVAVLSLGFAYVKEGFVLEQIMSVLPELLSLGILSSGVAYTLQIVGQREVAPHRASLIMSLESVVAALGGVFILGEILSARELSGMLLLFIGIIISQKK